MSSDLIKRKKAELLRIQAARLDIEVAISEKQDEVARLAAHAEIQSNTEDRLKQEINSLTEEKNV